MAITGPKGAEPTLKGWINPKTGELLKSQRISQTDIDEWFGVTVTVETPPAAPVVEEEPTDFNEDGTIDEFESMTKVELEELAREKGVELDRRLRKDVLVNKVKELFSK